jgi:RNA-directed DNA polymerase
VTTSLRDAVAAEAIKLIRRHERYAQLLAEETVRRRRRTIRHEPALRVLRPAYWELAAGFNPYLVRARADRITHSIRSKLGSRSYKPLPPVSYSVPKKGGGERYVAVFPVADNAVSRFYFKSLLRKNRPRMSSRSYAYREDLTVHDAVQHIQAEFAPRQRLFIAEYDFSDYFNSIRHDYILDTLDEHRYLITRRERDVIEAFLAAPEPQMQQDYSPSAPPRQRGVPQGTSISLFLANVAAAGLDGALERLGVDFVRYADDTIIWSDDYGRLCEAVDQLHDASKAIGSEVNLAKSEGVRLLVRPGATAELKPTTHVNFVGYKLTLETLEMRQAAIDRTKTRLQELLFFNLLREPLANQVKPTQLAGKVDRDYYVFLLQARRYLYGDLSEKALRRLQGKGSPPKRFKGLMSFYPLVDDTEILAQCDAWLASQAWLTMHHRARLLRNQGYTALPPPHDLPLDEFIRYRRMSRTTGGELDLRLPSFRRIANVVTQAARLHGPNLVGRGGQPYNY